MLIAAAGFAALFALALLPGAHGAFEMDNTGGTAACAVGGNTFVSAASTGLRLRSAALAEIAAPELSFSSPAASGGEGGAAVWDSGGGTLCLISPEGDAIEVSAGGRVVSAEVNPGGLTAAAVLPEDGLGLVTVLLRRGRGALPLPPEHGLAALGLRLAGRGEAGHTRRLRARR